jgi:hypothetical protein
MGNLPPFVLLTASHYLQRAYLKMVHVQHDRLMAALRFCVPKSGEPCAARQRESERNKRRAPPPTDDSHALT